MLLGILDAHHSNPCARLASWNPNFYHCFRKELEVGEGEFPPPHHRLSFPDQPAKIQKAAFTMQILFYFVVTIHVMVSLFLIGVVLLQQGRSADLAGAFGGQGSQTAFGPRAAANVLTRLTTWSAIIFMITSLSLTVLFVRSGKSHSVLDDVKPASSSAPAKPGK